MITDTQSVPYFFPSGASAIEFFHKHFVVQAPVSVSIDCVKVLLNLGSRHCHAQFEHSFHKLFLLYHTIFSHIHFPENPPEGGLVLPELIVQEFVNPFVLRLLFTSKPPQYKPRPRHLLSIGYSISCTKRRFHRVPFMWTRRWFIRNQAHTPG